jgi:NADH-quinone oxidoreductase subunit N
MDQSLFDSKSLIAAAPVLILIAWTTLLLVVDLFIRRKFITAVIALAGILLSMGVLGQQAVNAGGQAISGFAGMIVADPFALAMQFIFLLSAFIGILVAMEYLPRHGLERGEYYPLLLYTTAGAMFMALAQDLVMVFLALELLSIPLYVLSGLARPRVDSEEAALKYFLLGSFSSAFMVFGIALIYGGTGSTRFAEIVTALRGEALYLPLALLGMGLMIVGLGFKVAAVPFHMWTPDVYQGAPTPVTGYMSVSAKAGGFAALLRVLTMGFPDLANEWGAVITIVAALTLILGNVVAIAQQDIKRMLAYSSIAHAGYILIAVAAAQDPAVAPFAISAAVFYLLTYTFTNLGAFAVVMAVERADGSGTLIEDYAGLSKTQPFLAAAMTLFMLSLTGMPISAGLVGKFFVFQAAIEAAQSHPWSMIILAIIGVLTSVISAFYYLRIVLLMNFREGPGDAHLRPALAAGIVLAALVTFLLGIVPGPVFAIAQMALMKVGG